MGWKSIWHWENDEHIYWHQRKLGNLSHLDSRKSCKTEYGTSHKKVWYKLAANTTCSYSLIHQCMPCRTHDVCRMCWYPVCFQIQFKVLFSIYETQLILNHRCSTNQCYPTCHPSHCDQLGNYPAVWLWRKEACKMDILVVEILPHSGVFLFKYKECPWKQLYP